MYVSIFQESVNVLAEGVGSSRAGVKAGVDRPDTGRVLKTGLRYIHLILTAAPLL